MVGDILLFIQQGQKQIPQLPPAGLCAAFDDPAFCRSCRRPGGRNAADILPADYVSDPVAERREMEDEILERKRNKLKVTVREQIDARKGLEALRKYQEEVK
jgi:hypothetical protein